MHMLVKMTTCGAASDENVVKMMIFLFQCYRGGEIHLTRDLVAQKDPVIWKGLSLSVIVMTKAFHVTRTLR